MDFLSPVPLIHVEQLSVTDESMHAQSTGKTLKSSPHRPVLYGPQCEKT